MNYKNFNSIEIPMQLIKITLGVFQLKSVEIKNSILAYF